MSLSRNHKGVFFPFLKFVIAVSKQISLISLVFTLLSVSCSSALSSPAESSVGNSKPKSAKGTAIQPSTKAVPGGIENSSARQQDVKAQNGNIKNERQLSQESEATSTKKTAAASSGKNGLPEEKPLLQTILSKPAKNVGTAQKQSVNGSKPTGPIPIGTVNKSGELPLAKSNKEGAELGPSKKTSTVSQENSKKTIPVSADGKSSVQKRKSNLSPSALVPPPPPVIPSLSSPEMMPTVIVGGELIEYMSVEDLKELQIKTLRDLSKAKSDLTNQADLLDEKQKRAQSFDSLYAEGVVSKRELQNCKKEASDAESSYEQSKQLVQELEKKSSRIDERLKTLSKKSSAASKKIRKKS